MEIRNENARLNTKLNNIENNLDEMQQNKIKNNIIINGVYEVENENMEDVLINIGKMIYVDIRTTDIISAERKMTSSDASGMPRSIIIKLNNTKKRDQILTNQKQRNNYNINNDHRPIYISEQITPRKQHLCKIARDLKRNGIIKFIWVKNGDILIRKTENSKTVSIKHFDQLTKLQTQKNNEQQSN